MDVTATQIPARQKDINLLKVLALEYEILQCCLHTGINTFTLIKIL